MSDGSVNLDFIKNLNSYLQKAGVDVNKLSDNSGNNPGLIDIYNNTATDEDGNIDPWVFLENFNSVYNIDSSLTRREMHDFENIMTETLLSLGGDIGKLDVNDIELLLQYLSDPDTTKPNNNLSASYNESTSSTLDDYSLTRIYGHSGKLFSSDFSTLSAEQQKSQADNFADKLKIGSDTYGSKINSYADALDTAEYYYSSYTNELTNRCSVPLGAMLSYSDNALDSYLDIYLNLLGTDSEQDAMSLLCKEIYYSSGMLNNSAAAKFVNKVFQNQELYDAFSKAWENSEYNSSIQLSDIKEKLSNINTTPSESTSDNPISAPGGEAQDSVDNGAAPSASDGANEPSTSPSAAPSDSNIDLSESDLTKFYGHLNDVVSDEFKSLSQDERANAAKSFGDQLFGFEPVKYADGKYIDTFDERMSAIKMFYDKGYAAKSAPLGIILSYDDDSLDSYIQFLSDNINDPEVQELIIKEIEKAGDYGENQSEVKIAKKFLEKIKSNDALLDYADSYFSDNGKLSIDDRIDNIDSKISALPAEPEAGNTGESGFTYSEISEDNPLVVLKDSNMSDEEKYEMLKDADMSYIVEIINSNDTDFAKQIMDIMCSDAAFERIYDTKNHSYLIENFLNYYMENSDSASEYLTNLLSGRDQESYMKLYDALRKSSNNYDTDIYKDVSTWGPISSREAEYLTLEYLGKLSKKVFDGTKLTNNEIPDSSGEYGASLIMSNPSLIYELTNYGSEYIVLSLSYIKQNYPDFNLGKSFDTSDTGKDATIYKCQSALVAQAIVDVIQHGDKTASDCAKNLAAQLFEDCLNGAGTDEDMLCALVSACGEDILSQVNLKFMTLFGKKQSKLYNWMKSDTSGVLDEIIRRSWNKK